MTEQRQTTRRIIIFALIVNALAWLGPILGGDPTEPGLGFLLWGTAPIVTALVIKFVLRDPISLGFKPALRGNGRWYLLSLLLYPAAIGVTLLIGVALGATTISSWSTVAFLQAMLPLTVIYLVFALFEEVGWRGYLTPKVHTLTDGLLGHVIVGIIWASWHFPYMSDLWAHTSEGLITLIPRFVLGTIIAAVVYGEIRLRTASVWPAILMHWVGNAVANTLLTGDGFVSLREGREWLGSFGIEGIVMMVLFGLVGGFLYRNRKRQNIVSIQ